MIRCKGCDALLTRIIDKTTEDGFTFQEDLCHLCRALSGMEYSYIHDHTFQFEELKEGLQDPLSVDY